jgi:parallel beta-helix repeat protein
MFGTYLFSGSAMLSRAYFRRYETDQVFYFSPFFVAWSLSRLSIKQAHARHGWSKKRSGNGLYWININNVTIINANVQGFGNGIALWYSSNNSMSGNNIANSYSGIYLVCSSNNAVAGNSQQCFVECRGRDWVSEEAHSGNWSALSAGIEGLFAPFFEPYVCLMVHRQNL